MRITQVALTTGVFHKIIVDVSARASGGLLIQDAAGGMAATFNSVATHTYTGRATNTTLQMHGSANPTDITANSISVSPYAIADLLDLYDPGITSQFLRANLTITDNTQGGVCIAANSATSPTDFVLVYVDRVDNKLKAEKWVAGVFDSEIVNESATYVADKTLEVRWSDTNNDDTYDLWIAYNDLFVDTATVSNATIIGNTACGLSHLMEGGFAKLEHVFSPDFNDTFDKHFV